MAKKAKAATKKAAAPAKKAGPAKAKPAARHGAVKPVAAKAKPAPKAAAAKAAPAARPAPPAAKGKVSPIPEGQHALTPHLVVRGTGHAIEFYKHAFDAHELYRVPGPDGFSIMHASIMIGDSHLFLCDEFPDMDCKAPPTLGGTPVTVHLYVEDADKVFNRAVEAGARVAMPLADMFWGDRYGKLIDPFGHHWSIASRREVVSREQMMKRFEKEFGKVPKPEE